MKETVPKCSKCFAPGAKIEQFTFATQGDAFGLYTVLLRHGRLPMLCQDDSGFRVCDEQASIPGVAERGILTIV